MKKELKTWDPGQDALKMLDEGLKPAIREIRGITIYRNKPKPRVIRKGAYKYPWFELEVGECFEVPHGLKRIPAPTGEAKDTERKFSARRETGVLYIWREK